MRTHDVRHPRSMRPGTDRDSGMWPRQLRWRPLATFLVAAGVGLAFPVEGSAQTEAAALAEQLVERMSGQWKLITRFELAGGRSMEGEAWLDVVPILGGRGLSLTERQEPAVAGRPTYFESTVLYLDVESGALEGASVNSLGNRKTLDGGVDGDRVLFEQVGELFGGRTGRNRITWFGIGADSFSLRMDQWDPEDESWREGIYSFQAHRVQD